MKYFVTIDGAEHEVLIDGEQIALDGQRVIARLEDLPATPLQILAIGNEVHRILARRGAEKGDYDLSIDGYRITVQALDERTRVIRSLGGAAARSAGPAHLVAPMPGLVVRVNVKEGDQVRGGQGLVVMEAMKMENELRASAPGTVARILVAPGSAVEKGATLLEMESFNDR